MPEIEKILFIFKLLGILFTIYSFHKVMALVIQIS